jgi:HTH-type transcriptional regulator/antitoxin HigA
MDKNKSYSPDLAIHPGVTLKEELDFLGLTQVELAQRSGLSTKHISQIINEVDPITSETAVKFELALGIPADFWSNLQKNYELSAARIEAEKKILAEIPEAKKFNCYNELADLGYVEKTRDWVIKTKNLLKHFAINSFALLPGVEQVAFRQAPGSFDKLSLAAWLRCGTLEAKKIEVGQFDKNKIKEILPELKKLTMLPDNFGNKLQELCASVGIAVVFVPYFKNTKVNGASRWIGGKAVIQLNTKGSFSDIFWFTFFHEIGHILLHGIKDQFVDYNGMDKNDKEKEADEFASETLIPEIEYKKLLSMGRSNTMHIGAFARLNGIGKSIVYGRLAHDNFVSWKTIGHLREKLLIK